MPERDCRVLSCLLLIRGECGRCEILPPAQPARVGSIRNDCPPAAPRFCGWQQGCSCVSQPLGAHFQQRKPLRHIDQPFGLSPLFSGELDAFVLSVQKLLQTTLHTRRQPEVTDVTSGRHLDSDGLGHGLSLRLDAQKSSPHRLTTTGSAFSSAETMR